MIYWLNQALKFIAIYKGRAVGKERNSQEHLQEKLTQRATTKNMEHNKTKQNKHGVKRLAKTKDFPPKSEK
jgi:hypothetical protein